MIGTLVVLWAGGCLIGLVVTAGLALRDRWRR